MHGDRKQPESKKQALSRLRAQAVDDSDASADQSHCAESDSEHEDAAHRVSKPKL
jgi:hypothetical protein